jgi:hypothetical protein
LAANSSSLVFLTDGFGLVAIRLSISSYVGARIASAARIDA